MIASEKMRNKCSPLLLLFFVLLASPGTLGQSAGTQTNTTGSSRLEELREQGLKALFNLDYDAARESFKEISRLFRNDPLGPQMQAWTLWLEALNKSRLRQGAIYSSQSFEATAEDKPESRVTQEFRDLIRQSAQLVKVQLQRNPRDPQALYTMGAVETLRAGFGLTVEGRSLSALRDGSSGVDKDHEVIKLDPNFHDAELTIGLFDYIVGNLPLAVKLVASLAGTHGSKKRGIQTLERVAKEGRWERDNAKLLLMVLYKHEKRLSDSLVLSRELSEKYPRNYLFRLETADTLIMQAAAERQSNRPAAADTLEKEAIGIFDSLFAERSASIVPASALGLVHFRYGEGLLTLNQPDQAARQFLAAASANGADPGLVTRAHLRAAQSLDLAGKRNEALAEYHIVMARPNIRDSVEQARRGLKEPHKKAK